MARVPKPTGLQFRELSTGRFRDPVSGHFVPNPVGIKQLQNTVAMKFALEDVAEQIVEAAKELAYQDAYDTGRYRDSIRSAVGTEKDETGTHAVAHVNAFDFKSAWIEFGNINIQPPRKILQRAAEASGYRVSVGKNIRRIVGTGFERVLKLKGR